MEKIAELLTNYIIRKKAISEEDYEIYKYGFQIGTEMLVCMAVCCLIAVRMNMFDKCIILLLLFFSLRSFVGGLHMNSFGACFVCSCAVIFIILYAVKYCSIPPTVSLVISICEIIVLFFLPPVENINRPVDEKERNVFSHRIKRLLLVFSFFAIFLYIVGCANYLNTITYTLAAIIVSMILGKLKNEILKT